MMEFKEFLIEELKDPEKGKIWVKNKHSGKLYQVTKEYYQKNRSLYDIPDSDEVSRANGETQQQRQEKQKTEFDRVASQKWFSILNQHGKVYFVGGAVRDSFIGKESKDIDVVVQGLSLNHIENLLKPYGSSVMNEVGGTQAVLKFTPDGEEDDIDIAIPRTEKKIGSGHKGFDVSVDPSLPLEDDLKRRDFTINAIARDSDGMIIDPFDGQKDLKNKIIRVVNSQAFSDDPLRMLRAVQFASRFNFTIEPETMVMIRKNAHLIEEISGERIVEEFKKIMTKGDPSIGAQMLRRTGLFKTMFGWDGPTVSDDMFKKAKTMGEFFFLLTTAKDMISDDASDLWMKKFKGDKETAKEISALHLGSFVSKNRPDNRYKAFQIYRLSPTVFETDILEPEMLQAISDLKSNKYPKSFKELAVNGNDLGELGLKGKDIGKTLDILLKAIYNDELENNKEKLIAFVNEMDI